MHFLKEYLLLNKYQKILNLIKKRKTYLKTLIYLIKEKV